MKETALERIIKTGYDLLNLKTFFTSGEKESRAWAARKTYNACQCSGIIHSDIEKSLRDMMPFLDAKDVAKDK